ADPRAGRSHVGAGRRIGAPRPAGADTPDAEPDLVRHRASPLDDSPGRRHHRARARARRGDRTARGAGGAADRRLRGTLRDAAARSAQGGEAGGDVVIKSMTGFASVAHEDDRATIAVTVRTLNHRYLDIQLPLPQSLRAPESEVRTLITRP